MHCEHFQLFVEGSRHYDLSEPLPWHHCDIQGMFSPWNSTLPSWSFPLEEAFRGKRKMWLFLLAIRYFTNLMKLYTSLYQLFHYCAVLPDWAFKLALTRPFKVGYEEMRVAKKGCSHACCSLMRCLSRKWCTSVNWRLKCRSGMICWAICINLTFSN